jgi:hypothetical protein
MGLFEKLNLHGKEVITLFWLNLSAGVKVSFFKTHNHKRRLKHEEVNVYFDWCIFGLGFPKRICSDF